MVTVVGGSFSMGSNGANESQHASPALPGVIVGDFVMDAYEVTVARFRAFYLAGFRLWTKPIPYPNGSELKARVEDFIVPETTKEHPYYNWSDLPAGREAYPINRVHWSVAMSFCAWDGGRVPTDAEWEYAARGREVGFELSAGRSYPWGQDAPTCERANFRDCSEAGATSVLSGRLPAGGIFDLAGNVAEWTADNLLEYGTGCWIAAALAANPLCVVASDARHIIRGGAYSATVDTDLPSYARRATDTRSAPVGMRCVRDIIGVRTPVATASAN